MASKFLRQYVFNKRTVLAAAAATTVTTAGGYYYLNYVGPTYPPSALETRRAPPPWTPPSRDEMLARLKAAAKEGGEFDLLVVGGGATGAGVAVDAATRGLKVALVERDDFSSGTSSKSTKLVHGGVRYLQKAVMELDYEQYKLVREALHERKVFLQTAPYLSHMLPIMLPIYKYWQIPYYWAGCKMYDVLAGKENMEGSYLMSKGKALETFPMLKSDGLVGALVYYDGQHNDSRMNMALVMTAVKHGATVANYVEVTDLTKQAGKVNGATVKDSITGDEWTIKAKGVINATGPFSDALLQLDAVSAGIKDFKPIVSPSSGTHITLPNYYSPRKMGLLDPATSDGRVIFFLPWQGSTIAGTTDSPSAVTRDPVAKEEEIAWILDEVRHYLSPDIKVRRGDVLSAWTGLRPLVRDPAAAGDSTQGIVRNHMIYVSDSGLLTIAGGKWTTYREMAKETVDKACEIYGFNVPPCQTEKVRLIGSDAWSRNMFIGLIQRFGLETNVAQHLSENYGDRAWEVCGLAEPTGEVWPLHGNKIAEGHPFIDGEVIFAVRHEYAVRAVDVLGRRTRLAFLDVQASLDSLPKIIDMMSNELGWSIARRKEEWDEGVRYLRSMGMVGDVPDYASTIVAASPVTSIFGYKPSRHTVKPMSPVHSRAQFDPSELSAMRGVFDNSDGDLDSMLAGLKKIYSTGVSAETWEYVLVEAGYERKNWMNKKLHWEDMVEIVEILKEISFIPAEPTRIRDTSRSDQTDRTVVPVEKSGGGV